MIPDARSIITTLYPTLLESAHYAKLIQSRITELEEKEGTSNLFAAALSDADLSIQTHVELALLAHFPQLPFFGEEWKSSRNTKYLVGNNFIPESPYLITLDPIDGTRLYLDGHKLFQIILTVVSREGFEGAVVLYPAHGDYIYAINGEGAYRGAFGTPLDRAERYEAGSPPREVYIASRFEKAFGTLQKTFSIVHSSSTYNKEREQPHPGAILRGQLCGAIVADAQVIDGAAIAFIAREMGFTIQTLDGAPIPRPEDYPDLIFPHLVYGRTPEDVAILRAAVHGTV